MWQWWEAKKEVKKLQTQVHNLENLIQTITTTKKESIDISIPIDWETYKNEKYNYEFRYPLINFSVYTDIAKDGDFILTSSDTDRILFCNSDIYGPGSCYEGSEYEISVKPFNEESLEAMLKAQKAPDGSLWIKNFSTETKPIIIGGIQGLLAPMYTFIGGGVTAYIVKNDYLYMFSDRLGGGKSLIFDPRFSIILSTLKFIN